MKRSLLVILVVVLAVTFIAHRNGEPKIILASLLKKNARLSEGQLRYRIYLFSFFPVGDAFFVPEKMEEAKGKKFYHLQASAASLKIISGIFNASAMFDSYVSAADLTPFLFQEKITIGGKVTSGKEVTYDQKSGIMSIAGVKRQIPFGTQDPLSAILNIRRMDLDKVKDLEMNINTNHKNYLLTAKVEARGRLFFINAEIKRRDKNPYHKSSLKMVLLKDKANIPILIKVFSGGGAIAAKLVDIK